MRGSGPRPRTLRWEDDGISVPWLSSLTAVYIMAMQNSEFWHEVTLFAPLRDVASAVFIAVLLALLAALHALLLNVLTLGSWGALVPASLVLLASLAAWLTDRGVWIAPAGLTALADGFTLPAGSVPLEPDLPGPLWPLVWIVGVKGLLPAVLLARARIGTRYGAREMTRRGVYFMACCVLIGLLFGWQQRRIEALMQAQPQIVTLLNPCDVFVAGAGLLFGEGRPWLEIRRD